MSSVLISILALIVTLGLLIAFHEFGHYWVARRCGVKVLKFSIGFGKPLWSKTSGADKTEYVLAAVPLGGYVKMLDEREGEVPEADLPRAFNRQSLSKRVAIVSAGPIFNFIFAIVAYFIMFLIGIPGVKPVIGEIVQDSPAYQAGIQVGEQIVNIGHEPTPTWNAARITLLQHSLDSDIVTLDLLANDGSQRRVDLDMSDLDSEMKQGDMFGHLGIKRYNPPLPPVIGKLEAGGAAERDGLQVGDLVITVDKQAIYDWMEWVNLVRKSPEKTLQIEVNRQGVTQVLQVTPGRLETDSGEVIGRIGAAPEVPKDFGAELRAEEKYPFFAAMSASVVKTWQMSVLTLRMIFKMLTGEVSVKNLSGPITIATYAGITASIGLATFLSFLAVVSISLGVLNLLPIPILDGGHLLNYLIEGIKGSPLSEAMQLKMQQFGLVVLAMLMMLAFYNDLYRLFG